MARWRAHQWPRPSWMSWQARCACCAFCATLQTDFLTAAARLAAAASLFASMRACKACVRCSEHHSWALATCPLPCSTHHSPLPYQPEPAPKYLVPAEAGQAGGVRWRQSVQEGGTDTQQHSAVLNLYKCVLACCLASHAERDARSARTCIAQLGVCACIAHGIAPLLHAPHRPCLQQSGKKQ